MFYKMLVVFFLFLVSELSANYFDKLNSFEANFTQTITNSSKKAIKYKGKLFIQEPSRILWKYDKPIIKNVYVADGFAIIDEPELEQAIFTKLKDNLNLIQIIRKSKKVDDNLYVAMINKIKYKIFLKNNLIFKITYTDELENDVAIQFSKIKQNHKIDKLIFKFSVPNGYDIIRK